MDLVARENEILRLLNIVSKSGIDLIVVGGYAVSAHAKHRFSVDCDLVAKASDLRSLGVLLEKTKSTVVDSSGTSRRSTNYR